MPNKKIQGAIAAVTAYCLKITQNVSLQKLSKIVRFGIFHELLSTQNVNVARFARNVECYFFCDFQTPCTAANMCQYARVCHPVKAYSTALKK